jgi:Rod binding domain-containing protein
VTEGASWVAFSPGVDPSLSRATATLAQVRKLEGKPGTTKVQQAAREFESILLTQWLEQARQSLAAAPGGDEEDPADPGGEQMLSLGMQSLAAAVTKSGGIGIARLLIDHLENQSGGATILQNTGGNGDPAAPTATDIGTKR